MIFQRRSMIQLRPSNIRRQLPLPINPDLGKPGITVECHGPSDDAATVSSG